jgi:acyl carrier protein
VTRDEIRAAVVAALTNIAPEIDPGRIEGGVRLQDQVDIDSFDYLNLMIALHRDLGVEVPETDYGRLATLDAAVDYLEARMAPQAASSPTGTRTTATPDA